MRIAFPHTTPGGKLSQEMFVQLVRAINTVNRLKRLADVVIADGEDASALETAKDFEVVPMEYASKDAEQIPFPTGSGAEFYADLCAIKAALDPLNAIAAKYDMGQ